MKYIDKKGNIIDSGYVGDCLPISNARVLMVEELKKDMLLKLQKRQKAGKTDNWRELGLSVLFQRLTEELLELQVELKNIELDSGSADFDDARRECADVANYTAMIHDLLNGMELEAMHKRKEKNES
jgi:NTP pyrophosphatase (non-canonical NTP hydrolase)